MEKFEYKVIAMTPLYSMTADNESGRTLRSNGWDVDYLNELGNEGWEVCGVDGNKYLLKRKIY